MPTYHLNSCADDAGLRITHIIRGQEHLSNAFKHKLIFDAAGVPAQGRQDRSVETVVSRCVARDSAT